MNDLIKKQKLLLKTLHVFDKLCKDYGLTYYMAYGSLLGAIRHKGFIPWDDDIDVHMKRTDYNKLLSLKLVLTDNYKLADYHDDNYPYPFAKFYSTECTFIEYKQFPFITGPWIDIFPLDEINEEKEKMHLLYEKMYNNFWLYRKSISYQTWSEIWDDFKNLNGFEWLIKAVKQIRYSPFRKKYFKSIEKTIGCVSEVKGEKLRTYGDVEHIIYNKNWFDKIQRLPFEDIEVNVPVNYHEVLTISYGDYMVLPPEEKRKSTHILYFSDLNQSLTINQVNAIIKTSEQPSKPMTFKVIWDEFIHQKGFK